MKFLSKPGKSIKTIGEVKSKQEPTISIITPFYNGGETLEETANTIFSQTYPYFEWIIVDDGSKSESSLKKLEEISKKDSRIHVFHKENGGPSQARDFGISKSSKSSKYIYFLDCDDLIENTMLEEMYWALETHPTTSWVYVAMINFGAYEYYWEPYFTLEEELVLNTMCISSLVKKQDLLEVNCFGIKEKAMYEDWNLWLKLLAKGKRPMRLNSPLFWYRTSSSGELSRARSNHKKAMKLIESTSKTVKNEVAAIQFPRLSSIETTTNSLENMTIPNYKETRENTILFLVDNVNLSQNSLATIELIKRLSKTNKCLLVMTEPSKNNLRQDLKEYVSEVHDLSNFLDLKDYPLFIDYLISSRNINSLIINNSQYAYAMLPAIKSKYKDLKIIEYIESAPVSLRNSKLNKLVDTSLTLSSKLAEDLSITLVKPSKKSLKENAVDKVALKKKYGIPTNKTIISYIDNMVNENRPALFLEIVKELPEELFFIMNGNGKLSNTISNKIAKRKLKNVLYIPEQENYDELYQISDIVINCAYKEGVSATNYKAFLYGVPIVSTTADYQETIVTDKTGILVSERNATPENYAKEICNVLKKINIYKNDIQEKLKYFTNKYDALAEKINESLTQKSTIKLQDNYMAEVYTQYISTIAVDFKDKYLTYYNDLHNITPREDIKPGPLTKKQRLRSLGIKYHMENEMHYIFNWTKQIFTVCKNFVLFLYNLLLSIIKIIPLTYNIIKIILKLIRKVLSIIKQFILGLVKK